MATEDVKELDFETFHNFLISEIESSNVIVIDLNYLPFQLPYTPHAFLQRSLDLFKEQSLQFPSDIAFSPLTRCCLPVALSLYE